MDRRAHKAQRRMHELQGVGTIVPAPIRTVNAAKMLRLAMERDIRVVIKYKSHGARNGVQTAPVEIDEVENGPKAKVIFFSGIKDRKKAIELSRITGIHPALVSNEADPEDS